MLSLYLFELSSPWFVILLLFLQEKEVYLGCQLYMGCIYLLFLGSYPALLGKKKVEQQFLARNITLIQCNKMDCVSSTWWGPGGRKMNQIG